MRNEIFLKDFAIKICDFNYNKELLEKVEQLKPRTELHLEHVINEWLPEAQKKVPILREKKANNEEVINILKEFEETFLFEGCEKYYQDMIPKDSQIVFNHNDVQANNILASLKDSTETIIIDYEYAGWGPRALDIANYFNETSMENNYPLKNGVWFYVIPLFNAYS